MGGSTEGACRRRVLHLGALRHTLCWCSRVALCAMCSELICILLHPLHRCCTQGRCGHNDQNARGRTAATSSCRQRRPAQVGQLRARGECESQGWLCECSPHCFLLSCGAMHAMPARGFPCSALHFAAALGNAEATRLLLEAGADPDLQDKDGAERARRGQPRRPSCSVAPPAASYVTALAAPKRTLCVCGPALTRQASRRFTWRRATCRRAAWWRCWRRGPTPSSRTARGGTW